MKLCSDSIKCGSVQKVEGKHASVEHMHIAYKHDKVVDKHTLLCGVKRDHIRVHWQSKLKIIIAEYYKRTL
jgi:hypothetical protein